MKPVLLGASVLVITSFVSAPVGAQGDRPDASLATRIVGEGVRSLLVTVHEPVEGLVDELQIELPRGIAETAVPMSTPDGWESDRDGRWLRLFGDTVKPPIRLRIALFDTRELERLRTRIRRDGDNLWDERVTVAELPAIQTRARTAGVLQVPANVSPGETVEMEILDPAATPAEGEWLIAGVPARAVAANRIRVDLPSDLPVGAPLRVAFFDEWGERIVDVLSVDEVVVAEPAGNTPEIARITGCAEYGFIGQSVCVCGNFPESAWDGVRIDERPAVVTAASRRVLHLRLPDSLTPGVHQITGDPGVGFSAESAVSTRALRLRGSLDVQALLRGQSTTMRVALDGTTEPIMIAVTNRTPGIVSIPGGNYQEIETTGGVENNLERPVDARSVGNFEIVTRVSGPACPCMEQEENTVSAASRDEPLLVPGRVLATIAAAAPQAMMATAQAVAVANGLAVVDVNPLALTNEALVVFEILDGIGPILKAVALAADPNVILAQPDFIYDVSQDGAPSAQLVYGPGMIGVDLARSVASGEGVRIAVIDAGVDTGHQALEGRVVEYVDVTGTGWTPDVHGTLVAGVIAAEAVAGGGVEGVAPDAELVAVKSCVAHAPTRAAARCWSSTLARGVDVASGRDVRVMNLSVGGPEDRLLARVVGAARDAGIVVVAAAGNDGPSGKPSYPAAFDNVIAVTAVDAASRIYSQATRGSFVDLAAPGVDIQSTSPGGRTQLFSGTSAATAFASGAVALLMERTDLTPDELQALLAETARDLGQTGPDADFGNGLIDVCRAIAQASGGEIACR